MIITNISLLNFRNYNSLEVQFQNGINNIYGENASGKTNLIEAIQYLSIAKSFRGVDDTSLIKFNEKEALIKSQFKIGNNIKKINILIEKNGKKILIDNKNISKLSELSLNLNIIYFLPKDTNLFKESPKSRRNFLNVSISKQYKEYFEFLKTYQNILKNRNEELKKENCDLTLISIYSDQLIEVSKKIYLYRKKYIKLINNKISDIYSKIVNKKHDLKLRYYSFINDEKEYINLAKEKYKNSLEIDLKTKRTNTGVHLEDFSIYLDGKDITIYGSQAQNRISIISLKLVPYYLIENESNKPIIILDDVLSELDSLNIDNFINLLNEFNQVFITSTSKLNYKNISNYCVKNNNVILEE